ncbi:MAG: accessory factor UbiK family protein [Alphaproteobacteria bacterium]|nr:accessory factor UbiK family protein [Alphaproteobacteria bacterium]
MQTDNRLFDDLARLAGGAMGAAAGLRAEFEGLMRQQLDRLLAGMDLVRREEFDAVQAMAAKARTEQEALAARVEALEAALAAGRRETSSPG